MRIENARPEDVSPAVGCLVAAFTSDPLMAHFFPGSPAARERSTAEFFSLLLRARLALRMPAIVATDGSDVIGLAMGYDTTRPDWPAPLAAEWDEFSRRRPGLTDRLDAYKQISDTGLPADPHFYLGVIGVAPAGQGRGVGSQLLRAFCSVSEADRRSTGVYLETATPSNVPFYERHGFEVRAEGALGSGRLWCLYHTHHRQVDASDT